ncbi:response regulator transcription factor [Citromicrobium bathyomarinum]|uniref:response regulator transcription factor n=1 Tax=Citromicrobium bathyomarinum TaxID=72174 RepID=UPI001E3F9E2B|nr:response regulator transcription factor [Citromicrobium bathyomarinum]
MTARLRGEEVDPAMRKVNILLTGELPGPSPQSAAGEMFDFQKIGPGGPSALVDGPTWIFVDWIMPEISGLEMVRRLRADDRLADAHITIVLEQDDDEDRRRAIKAGADDYVVGPLDRNGVLDRILTLQSQHGIQRSPPRTRVGLLEVVPAAQQARWDGTPLKLSPNEFRLLRFLVEHRDEVLSRQRIIEGLGKLEPPIDERTVDVWIGRLRRAFRAADGPEAIRTVRKQGYAFDLEG